MAGKTTALARRRPASKIRHQLTVQRLKTQIARLESARVQVLPPAEVAQQLAVRTLTDEIDLGKLGLVTIAFTEKEEAILAEPIEPDQVSVLPTGAVYYSHIQYTRWFNRAFGRGQWANTPATKPRMTEMPADYDNKPRQLITQAFILYVHGQPISQATAEHIYHPDNADQTYGDVIESLNASALRRHAKRLGIGLELWDRAWSTRFLEERAVKVKVGNRKRPQWRLKTSPALYGESGPWRDADPRPSGERVQERNTDTRPISDPQLRRLITIATKAGRTDDEVKGYLRIRYGIDSKKKIRRCDYDAIVSAVEKPGDLRDRAVEASAQDEPEWLNDREPGMEG